ncbi:MAG: PAS domain S-box protein, partial [candidate division Zixibacteria bacterium]
MKTETRRIDTDHKLEPDSRKLNLIKSGDLVDQTDPESIASLSGIEIMQRFLDSFVPVALLIRPGTREIVASNKAGKEVGAVPGKTCYETWGQSDKPCPWCQAPRQWKSGESVHCQPEGLGRVWDAHWIPFADDLYLHYAEDITEHVRKEEALERSEEEFRSVFEDAGTGMAIRDKSGCYVRVNSAMCRLFGYTEEELLKMKVGDLSHPDNPEPNATGILSLWSGETASLRLEKRYFHKDGHVIWGDVTLSPIHDNQGKVISLSGQIQDITDRKQAEEALWNNREKLRALIESIPVAIYETDEQGNCVYINEQWQKISGLSKEEALGCGWKAALHEDDSERVFESWSESEQGRKLWDLEYRFRTPEGKVNWIMGRAAAMRGTDGRVSGYIGANVDITARKLAEEALKTNEAKLRSYIKEAADGVLVIDSSGKFMEANPTACRMYGYSESEFLQLSIPQTLAPESQESGRKHFQRVLAK